MNSEKIKKLILVLVIICVLGYIYYYFYLSAQIFNIRSVQQEMATKKNTIDKLINKRQTIDNEIKEVEKQNVSLNNEVPDTNDKKVLIAYFYNLIKQYNLGSDKIIFADASKTEDSFKRLTVNIKVDGESQNIKDFIRILENDKRKCTIKQASFSQGLNGICSCNIVVEFYSLR